MIELDQDLLDHVKIVAEEAGQAVLQIYQQHDFEIKIKSDQSPLTQADLASHDVITKALNKLTPKIPILSEEGEKLKGDVQTFWCVDPLDGTKEFIKRNAGFTVNIALIEQHQPVLGVIHVPVTHETFMALQGEGAFKVQDNQTQRLTKQADEIHSPPIFALSRSHLNDKTKAFIDRYQATTIPAGSSLKLTLLAEGLADAYPRFGSTSLRDSAAGHCISIETDGEIIDLNGQFLKYIPTKVINKNFIAIKNIELISIFQKN